MTIKEIQAKAGPLWGYLFYFLPLFVWYFADNVYTSLGDAVSEKPIVPFLNLVFRIFIVPLIMAGVFGGIHEQQQSPDTLSTSAFFSGAKRHYWRMLAANLLFLIVYVIVVLALGAAGLAPADSEKNRPLIVFITSPFSAILLFWFAAMIVERGLFRGLLRGLKTLLLNPYALAIGIAWAVLSAADSAAFDAPGQSAALVLNGTRAAVLAGARIISIVYALAVYKQARGDAPEASPEELAALETPSTSSGDGWVRAGFGFAFLAFVPLIHLLALACGIIALQRKKQFVLRSAIACCVGGFFTIFYFLVIAGLVVGRPGASDAPGYAFLAEANPGMEQQVSLLEQGSDKEIQQQLAGNTSPTRHWALDSISALAKYDAHDLNGALEDFRLAAEKKPEPGEFYYYYGVVLLDKGETESAARQFHTALAHTPGLTAAQRYLDLIDAIYEPSTITSSVLSILILLIMFALHEYGHAYAAWKLGDDTGKNLGRLTLNPIAHLDLFGSIILPGILLIQQAGVVFGWAKPVPVNPANFQNPRRDHVRVAFAGPAVNLIIAMVCCLILGSLMLLVRIFWPETLSLNLADPFSSVSLIGPPMAQWIVYAIVILKHMFYTSLVLGCFNLIPVPPLDGSWILSGLLPENLSNLFETTRRYGSLVFLLLVITPAFDYVMTVPLGAAWIGLQVLVSFMGFS